MRDEFSNFAAKGNALLLSLAALSVFSILSATFVRVSCIESKVAQNYCGTIEARLTAEAGMEHAIAKLRERYHFSGDASYPNELYDESVEATERKWLFWKADPEPCWQGGATFCGLSSVEDHIGAGVKIEDLDDTAESHPSFYEGACLNGKRKTCVSGTFEKRAFTLKIVDTTSQVNLNSQIDPFAGTANAIYKKPETIAHADQCAATFFDNLSQAITRLSWYTSDGKRDLSKGPFRGLGTQIVAKRNALGGFRSKWDLVGVSDATATITRDDVRDIWDFISVYPGVDQFRENPTGGSTNFNPYQAQRPDKSILAGTPGDPSYNRDYRSPININTASWPVLVALFHGLKCVCKSVDASISRQEAEELATRVCVYRKEMGTFLSWQDWTNFLESEIAEKNIFATPPANCYKKLAILNSALNPETHRFWFDDAPSVLLYTPSLMASQPERRYLEHLTTHLCFYPTGLFEVTCLGEIQPGENAPSSQEKIYGVLNVYNLLSLGTQEHFHGTQTQDFATRQAENAFSFPHNLQKDPPLGNPSAYCGSVQPILSRPSGDGELSSLSGHGELVSSGNLRFRCDFNGTLNADWAKDGHTTKVSPRVPEWVVKTQTGTDAKDLDTIQPSGTLGHRAADGHHCIGSALSYDAGDGVSLWQPWNDEEDDNLPTSAGTLSFWFKIDSCKTWEQQWKTTVLTTSSRSALANWKDGVQMEIAMWVDFTGKNLQIQARRKYYQRPGILLGYFDYCPYTYVDYGIRVNLRYQDGYGFRPHEWYHLAVRWTDGTYMGGFQGPALVISGNFYGSAGGVEKVMHSGPALGAPVYNTYYDSILSTHVYSPWPLMSPRETNDMKEGDRETWLACLEPDEVDANPSRMYFGMVAHSQYASGPPGLQYPDCRYMVYDDIRVSTYTDWNAYNEFLPSRYPWKDPASYTIGKFEGEIPAIPGVTWGPHYYTLLPWKSEFVYDQNPFYDPLVFLPILFEEGNKIYGIQKEKWEKIWKDAIQKKPPHDWWETLTGQHKPKKGVPIMGKGYLTPDPASQPKPAEVKYTVNTGGEVYLWQSLLDWYFAVYSGGDPLKLKIPIKNPGASSCSGPISMDPDVYDYATRKYAFKFRAPQSSSVLPLYQCPIVDNFTISYCKPHVQILEYGYKN